MARKVRTETKPLSANDCFYGRKRRTHSYNKYRKVLLEWLPDNLRIPKKGELSLRMNVYYSRRNSDIDNCVKPFIDILAEKYGFNDSRIYHIDIQKLIVPKGSEGILFKFSKYKGEIKW